MQVECVFNYGFEDVLTEGKLYEVESVGENSFQIIDDSGNKRWYGNVNLQFYKGEQQ